MLSSLLSPVASRNNYSLLIRIFEYITQEALDSGTITQYQLTVTIPHAAVLFLRSKNNTPEFMSKKVLENIAAKYKNVQKGVNDIMGGHVLEHEGKTIYNAGVAEGRREANIDTARRLR